MESKAPALRDEAQRALEAVKSTNPDEAKALGNYLAALHHDSIHALATDEVFALRDKQGEIRAFKQRVHLSAQDGTLVQPGYNLPYIVSATGYVKLAEAAGVIVMNAPTVVVDGKEQQNPYVSRDPENGRILGVYCRCIAFRYSSKGIPQVSDRTAFFDVPAYRMIDLLGKAKKIPQAFKLLPADAGKPEDEGQWAAYKFDEATTLFLNTTHNEALQFLAQHINREKKALEFAQTFAQRNAVKHLLGLHMPPGQDSKRNQFISEWDVEMICWRPTNGNVIKWDQTRYVQTVKNLAAVAGGEGDIALPEANTGILIKTGMDSVNDDEEALAAMTEADPDDPADRAIDAEFSGATTEHPAQAPEPQDDPATRDDPEALAKAMRQLDAAKDEDPDLYNKARRNLGIAPGTRLGLADINTILGEMANIIESMEEA